MNSLEALKAAKKYLATANDSQGKTNYVCHAVGRAFVEKYGNFLEIPGREKTQEQTAFNEKLEAVREKVVERLFRLQSGYGIDTLEVFTNGCARAVLGLPQHQEVTREEVQFARHIWLDSMIKELENEESN